MKYCRWLMSIGLSKKVYYRHNAFLILVKGNKWKQKYTGLGYVFLVFEILV